MSVTRCWCKTLIYGLARQNCGLYCVVGGLRIIQPELGVRRNLKHMGILLFCSVSLSSGSSTLPTLALARARFTVNSTFEYLPFCFDALTKEVLFVNRAIAFFRTHSPLSRVWKNRLAICTFGTFADWEIFELCISANIHENWVF